MRHRAMTIGAILALAALVAAPPAAWADGVETGGGLETEAFGVSEGVANPGLENFDITHSNNSDE